MRSIELEYRKWHHNIKDQKYQQYFTTRKGI